MRYDGIKDLTEFGHHTLHAVQTRMVDLQDQRKIADVTFMQMKPVKVYTMFMNF